MSLIATKTEWHDLRIDPDDLPGEEEPVLVTLELIDGDRTVWSNAFYRYNCIKEDNTWYTYAMNEAEVIEETPIWYEVIAWAYLPEPYYV